MRGTLATFSVVAMMVVQLAHADADPVKPAFCSRTFEDIKELALDQTSRIAFANTGGIGGGGLCWWHSRLQRASLYLAVYRPERERPSVREARRIVANLSRMRIVEIPGYSNFFDFSRDYSDVILRRLSQWQLEDGIAGFRWIDGLVGRTHIPAKRLKARMDDLYRRYRAKRELMFHKLQVPGIAAHAWLLVDMMPSVDSDDDGYLLQVIDSNYPMHTIEIRYRVGDTSLVVPYDGDWTLVPYVDYGMDLKRIRASIRKYCGRRIDAGA